MLIKSDNSLVPVMAMVKVSMRSLGLILPELLVSRARKMFLSTISASHLREGFFCNH